MSFVSDAVSLVAQALIFYYVALMIDPATVPSYGGSRPGYMAFVAVGIGLSAFLQVGLGRMATAIRQEQVAGTLESLLLTPTRMTTLQLGSICYDLVYVPIQTALFLLLIAVGFGIDFNAAGLAPAAVLLVVFLPFAWGLGVITAAGILTFRRGSGLFGIGGYLLTFLSGAYFPLTLFPGWVQAVAQFNPIAIALEGMRQALLGDASWPELTGDIALLALLSAASLAFGVVAFRGALRRELRRGSLGLY
jgi:ABC-2 type transport system permease protein